jgi:hypothetical protein
LNEPENLNSFFLKDPQNEERIVPPNNLFTIVKFSVQQGIRDLVRLAPKLRRHLPRRNYAVFPFHHRPIGSGVMLLLTVEPAVG